MCVIFGFIKYSNACMSSVVFFLLSVSLKEMMKVKCNEVSYSISRNSLQMGPIILITLVQFGTLGARVISNLVMFYCSFTLEALYRAKHVNYEQLICGLVLISVT